MLVVFGVVIVMLVAYYYYLILPQNLNNDFQTDSN